MCMGMSPCLFVVSAAFPQPRESQKPTASKSSAAGRCRAKREVWREGLEGLEGCASAPVTQACALVLRFFVCCRALAEFKVHGQGRGVAGSLHSHPILLCLRHSASPGPRLAAFLSVLESPVNSCVCRGDRLAIKSSQS